MSEKAAPTPLPLAPKPWRKRHPVLSRTILYSLGAGLAVLLVVLLNDRLGEDRDAEIDALQKQLDGLSLVLTTDPTGDRLLQILDETFADPGLPVLLRGRVLRWRAMAWRRKAENASAAGDSMARDGALAEADAAFEACEALDLAPAERYALRLERAEALLLRQRVSKALAVLPDVAESPEVVLTLMRQFLFAQARRLQGKLDEALAVLRATLRGLEGGLDGSRESYVGGREWTVAQIAVEMANFLTSQGRTAADVELWIHLRTLGADDYEVQKSAAQGLAALGEQNEALTSWRNARRLNSALADVEAARSEDLGRLEKALRAR